MTEDFSVSFYAVPKRNDPKIGVLRCSVYWNGGRVQYSLGTVVYLKDWLKDAQLCKPRSYHGISKTPASQINREIEQERERVINAMSLLIGRNEPVTVDDVKFALTKSDKQQKDVIAYFKEYMDECMSSYQWTQSTYANKNRIKSRLLQLPHPLSFEVLITKGKTLLSDIHTNLKGNTTRKGLNNSTINNEFQAISTFLRWAEKKGYCSDIKRFTKSITKAPEIKKPVIFLEWDELMNLYTLIIENPCVDEVRDIFCFCAFTSLRFSDVRKLKTSDISNDSLTIVTQKTSKRITIELNRYAKSILDKYKGMEYPDGRVFPVRANNYSNVQLRHLAMLAGITKPVTIETYRGNERESRVYKKCELITTHVARKTFISNAIMLGIPPEIVMKWTGHSDYASMKPYIDVADKAKGKAMKMFDNL